MNVYLVNQFKSIDYLMITTNKNDMLKHPKKYSVH